MYAIKMNDDKTLVTTSRASIYRGDRDCDMLVFYLPVGYDEVSIADCTVSLNYILPNAEDISEIDLGIPVRLYKGYLVYELSVDEKLTARSGDITVWLDFRDGLGVSYFRSTDVIIPILAAPGSGDYITQDDLDEIAQKVETLEKTKADNITYDENTGELQLTAMGDEVGDAVVVSSSSEDSFGFNIISGGGASITTSSDTLEGGDAEGVE